MTGFPNGTNNSPKDNNTFENWTIKRWDNSHTILNFYCFGFPGQNLGRSANLNDRVLAWNRKCNLQNFKVGGCKKQALASMHWCDKSVVDGMKLFELSPDRSFDRLNKTAFLFWQQAPKHVPEQPVY